MVQWNITQIMGGEAVDELKVLKNSPVKIYSSLEVQAYLKHSFKTG
jgi:hypothetical protein